jgi:hypothetical protein
MLSCYRILTHHAAHNPPPPRTPTISCNCLLLFAFTVTRTPSLALPVSTSTHAYDRHAAARAHFGTYPPRYVHTSMRFTIGHDRSQSVNRAPFVPHTVYDERCMTNSGLAHSIEERGNRDRRGVIRDPPRHFYIHEGALAKQDPGSALVAHAGGWILGVKGLTALYGNDD